LPIDKKTKALCYLSTKHLGLIFQKALLRQLLLLAFSSFGFPVINLSTETPHALVIWDNVFTVGFSVVSFSIFTIGLCEMPER